MRILAALLLGVAVTAAADNSNCIKNDRGELVCGRGECAADQYKKVFCAKAGGGAVKDRFGNVVCGVGYCAKGGDNEIKCSKEAGGSAAVDRYKEVKCTGGCEPAAAARCEEPKE
jgi:hypothetical protein